MTYRCYMVNGGLWTDDYVKVTGYIPSSTGYVEFDFNKDSLKIEHNDGTPSEEYKVLEYWTGLYDKDDNFNYTEITRGGCLKKLCCYGKDLINYNFENDKLISFNRYGPDIAEVDTVKAIEFYNKHKKIIRNIPSVLRCDHGIVERFGEKFDFHVNKDLICLRSI